MCKIDITRYRGWCGAWCGIWRWMWRGQNIDYIIDTLEQVPCKMRGTSCPDQLANALKIYKEFVYNKNIYEGDDGY